MGEVWTRNTLAGHFLEVLPIMGRIMTRYVAAAGEERVTLMQTRVLLHLVEHPLTVSKLAKRRRVSPQSASTLVQGLVERGWVVRVPDPDDRRQWLLEVTPEGLQRAQIAKQQMANYLAGYLTGLESEEIAAAQVFLSALKRVLTERILAENMPDPFDDIPDDLLADDAPSD